MGFFKAPEANAEINRLAALIVTLEGSAAKHAEQLAAKDTEFKLAREKAKEDLATSAAKITELSGQITTLTGERDSAKGEVTKLQGEAKTAEERATQILAGMGINQAVKKEGAKEEAKSDGKTEEQLWEEYHAIAEVSERRAFFVKHKSVLGK